MIINLVDRNKGMCDEWRKLFKPDSNVIIKHGDFFSVQSEAVVSPANSFGFMDGGLDLAISEKLGWYIQDILRDRASKNELLVGQADYVELTDNTLSAKYLISAPTMRVPSNVNGTINAYLAMIAALKLALTLNIKSILISGLCSATGGMPYSTVAKQMYQAYKEVVIGGTTNFNYWQQAVKHEDSLK